MAGNVAFELYGFRLNQMISIPTTMRELPPEYKFPLRVPSGQARIGKMNGIFSKHWKKVF
jgi:hypothetical protein